MHKIKLITRTDGVTELRVQLVVELDKKKLLQSDAASAELLFAELKRSWQAAWQELLTGFTRIVGDA